MAKQPARRVKREQMWAIASDQFGLCTGTWLTREEAIYDHAAGRPWENLRRRGDRCVRVTITWTEPARKERKKP